MEWMGAQIDLKGSRLDGDPLFWIHPRLLLRSQSRAELQDLQKQFAHMPGPLKDSLRGLPEMKGRADLDLQVTADMQKFDQAQFEGKLTLANFSTVLTGDTFVEPILLKQAQLSF